ncbi:hypothetical protein SGO26_29475 (plasmid) [Cupriavidus metallidurans]|uniref:hypothetical protein n=1 Tax=Cupriavidus metallidurans TaxID=119219 RepID=UPI003D73781A
MPQSAIVLSVFVPPNIGHAKRKAKQLRRAFPRLGLPLAQQVTAEALGFPDWYRLDQAVKRGLPSSQVDSCVEADEIQSRRKTQIRALALRGELSESDAAAFQSVWGLTSYGARQAVGAGLWPELPDDPEVDEFLKKFETRASIEALAAQSPHALSERQPRLIIIDSSDPLPELSLRPSPHAKGKSRQLRFGLVPHPLELTDIPPDVLEEAIARWRSSDAEFFVVYSGGGVQPDETIVVRRLNNLLSEVLPRLVSASARGHAIAVDIKAQKSVERLCQSAASRVSRGRLRDAFRPEVPGMGADLDPVRVQVTSREYLHYEETLMAYLFDRWWGAVEQRAAAGIETWEDAISALRAKSRATMTGDGAIVMQYLLPDGDSACIVLDRDCYTMLPPGYQDTARRFALASAAEDSLWYLGFQRKAN